MPIRIPFIADVAAFLRGTTDMEKALEDVEGALDELGRNHATEQLERDLVDVATEADQAAEKIERSFSEAFDQLKREGRTATRRVKDDVDDFRHDGGGAMRDFRDEAKQNLAESVSSFRGDAESAVDAVQSTFGGLITAFGPLGLAAATAVGAGIGVLRGLFAEAEERTAAFEERVKALFEEIAENGDITLQFKQEGIKELLSDADRLKDLFGTESVGEINRNLQNIGLDNAQVEAIFGGLVGGFEDVSAALGVVGAAQATWHGILTDPATSSKAKAQARDNLSNLAEIETSLRESGDAAGEAQARVDLYGKAINEVPTEHDTAINVDDHGSASRASSKVDAAARDRTSTVKVSVDTRGVQEEIQRVVGGKVYRFDVAPRPGQAVGV